MKPKLYLETTIPSYYVAKPSRDLIAAGQQACTRDWWERRRMDFDIHISQIVIDEVSVGDGGMAKKRLDLIAPFPLLTLNDQTLALTKALMNRGPLPVKAVRDATHIALSAIYSMHFLLTWNCKHIANAAMFEKVRKVCRDHGFNCPVICTPNELLAK